MYYHPRLPNEPPDIARDFIQWVKEMGIVLVIFIVIGLIAKGCKWVD